VKTQSKLLVLMGLICMVGTVASKPPEKSDPILQSALRDSRTIDDDTYIDANKVLMFVTNHGNFGRDLAGVFDLYAGTFYPYSTIQDIHSGLRNDFLIYAAGLWVGGKVNGQTRVAISEYIDEYVPGPMAGGTFQPDDPAFRVYKLYRDSLGDNPNDDFLNWPVDQGAPVDSAGSPLMKGDQMLWAVFNDADPSQHTHDAGQTVPLGLEVQMTCWAVDEPGEIVTPTKDRWSAVHTAGSSPGSVDVAITDYGALTGDSLLVVFEPDDTLGSTWSLIDAVSGAVILHNQTDQNGTSVPTPVGMSIAVNGGPLGVGGWVIPNGIRRFTWAGGAGNLGWEGLNGALGWGGPGDTHGFGLNDPVPYYDLPTVLLKLAPTDAEGNVDPSHPDLSFAYRYGRGFSSPPAQPEFAPYIINTANGGYTFQDFVKSMPISAWNVDVDPPQRLTLGYLENNAEFGMVDGEYWPPYFDDADNTAGDGPREWLWVYLDDYSETANPAFQGDAIEDSMPIMYWATWARRMDEGWNDEDEFLIIPRHEYSNTPMDTFSLVAAAPDTLTCGGEGLSIYMEYKLYNKGGNDIEDCYLSIWSDPDLGDAGDDLVGCDTLSNLFFCYNNDNDDAGYYLDKPPAVGFKILAGPLVPAAGSTAVFGDTWWPDYHNLGLTSFINLFGGTDPNNPPEAYNYLQGLDRFGDPLPNGTRYMVPGDPVTGTGDLDHYPSDRRMLGSTGPFDFPANDSQYFLIKLAVGQGEDRLASITNMKENLNAPSTCCLLRGDINHVDSPPIDISDIIYLVSYLFIEGPPPVCHVEGDVNGDGNPLLDISDLVYLIDYAFRGGPTPPPCP